MNGPLRTWSVRAAIAAIAALALYPALTEMTGGASFLPPVEPQQALSIRSELTSPHGPEPQCAACHRAHTAIDEQLLVAEASDLAICTRCHSAGGEEPKSTHGNVDFPYATEAPFVVSCTACHDPHGDPDGPGNRAMIRPTINGYDVRLRRETGEDSYDDGLNDGVVDSLCVVCHTTTAHNTVFSAELQGEGHGPVGSDCLSCHRHGNDPARRSGFMAAFTPTATPTPLGTDTPSPTTTAAPTETPLPTDTPPPTEPPVPTDTPSAAPSPTP